MPFRSFIQNPFMHIACILRIESLTTQLQTHPSDHQTQAMQALKPQINERPAMTWDIFCHVIDNYGDIGVCYRLAEQLALKGFRINLYTTDNVILQWLAPENTRNTLINIIFWNGNSTTTTIPDVLIECFGCTIDEFYLKSLYALLQSQYDDFDHENIIKNFPIWLNLEYLSAEDFVERNHGLSSMATYGVAKGAKKYFFYPGFTSKTGGLLHHQAIYDELPLKQSKNNAFHDHNQPLKSLTNDLNSKCLKKLTIFLFCYETSALKDFFNACYLYLQKKFDLGLVFYIAYGQTQQVVSQALNKPQTRMDTSTSTFTNTVLTTDNTRLYIKPLSAVPQKEFDVLLSQNDINFVRGEDSLVQALYAGKPFIWHIYPQHDHAHHTKLVAFLEWLQVPQEVFTLHCFWNQMVTLDEKQILALIDHLFSETGYKIWKNAIEQARTRLLRNKDLVTNLLSFVQLINNKVTP